MAQQCILSKNGNVFHFIRLSKFQNAITRLTNILGTGYVKRIALNKKFEFSKKFYLKLIAKIGKKRRRSQAEKHIFGIFTHFRYHIV